MSSSNNNTSSSSYPYSSSSSSGGKTNWEPILRNSSALGIYKPGVVSNVFGTSSTSSYSSMSNTHVVRTSHRTEDGLSVFIQDEILPPAHPFGPKATGFTVLDVRNRVPVRLDEHLDASQVAPSAPRCPPAGVIAVIREFPGGGYVVPMHRTQSLDYAVVLSGEIVLGLDGGEEKVLGVGDVIVQQGVNHTWVNRAVEPCRVLFFMVGAEKVVLQDGTVLEETVIGST